MYFSREDETLSQSNSLANPDIVRCTNHMCPLRVHWHVKNNYRDYWRVKLTISNYNYNRSYSDWNVLIQHPGFSKPALTYSFNSTLLPTAGIPGTCMSFPEQVDLCLNFNITSSVPLKPAHLDFSKQNLSKFD